MGFHYYNCYLINAFLVVLAVLFALIPATQDGNATSWLSWPQLSLLMALAFLAAFLIMQFLKANVKRVNNRVVKILPILRPSHPKLEWVGFAVAATASTYWYLVVFAGVYNVGGANPVPDPRTNENVLLPPSVFLFQSLMYLSLPWFRNKRIEEARKEGQDNDSVDSDGQASV